MSRIGASTWTTVRLVLALVAVLTGAATVAVLTGAATVAGQDDLNHAGLVVRDGEGRLTYAYVAFAEETIDGVELLRRSTIPVVTVPFGGLGEGVCSLAGEGCPAGECRRRVCQGPAPDDPYWRYFRQETPGAWGPQALGGSATRVRDGDIDGWSWTGGDANLPAVTLADVAGAVGADPDALGATARTVLPDGVGSASQPGATQDWPVYAAAAGIIAAIGAGAAYGVRRRRGHRVGTAA